MRASRAGIQAARAALVVQAVGFRVFMVDEAKIEG
jgi:hypothetical protein